MFALRDAADPALDDQWTCGRAWYHTSTDPDWPNGTRTMPTATDGAVTRMLSPGGLRRARARYETQALHLGTYEAAIVSMLRRMRDQADGRSQFYLYRVKLRHALAIEAGWRDENHAAAAQITQSELGDLDGIRYLNVREAPGSISLAVRRRAVAATQRVALPLAVPGPSCDDVITEVAQIRAQIGKLEALRPTTSNPLDQIRADAARKGGAISARSPSPEQYALLDKIDKLLEETYLLGISRPVRCAFTRALQARQRAGDADGADYIAHFAATAAALTNPDAVLRALASQPIQELEPWQP